MWTLCGMDWVLGSSGFWIKQRWLKTLHHQSQTIKGQTRFKSLPHYFPEPCSLGRGLFPCKILFFSIHTIYFSAPTLHIFLAQVSASKTDCFLFLDVISVSWSRQRLYLPIAMCQAGLVLRKGFCETKRRICELDKRSLTPKSFKNSTQRFLLTYTIIHVNKWTHLHFYTRCILTFSYFWAPVCQVV